MEGPLLFLSIGAQQLPEPFHTPLTGFVVRDDEAKEVWGRPVDVLQWVDGSLLVSDDGAGRIFRIRYAR